MSTQNDLTRRRFLQRTSSLLTVAALAPQLRIGAQDVAKTGEFITGKDPRLIIHNRKVGELETPLELLREHHITPKQLLFVRNNQILPGTLTIDPAEVADWAVELTGLVNPKRSIPVRELTKLPQEECELVLQCSGNGRSRFSQFAKVEGAPWQHGAMGNVKFRGVKLAVVLDHLGLKPEPQAKFVTAEGKDTPAASDAADFEHSLPLGDVLERSLLAVTMNDEPIPKVHGGPVRFVTPGYYATMNVKWLQRLRFEDRESNNHHHVGRYRTPRKPITPGDKFTSTIENSEANWNMRIKSVIFAPLNAEKLMLGETVVRGVAWNDGMAKITSVDVSIDGGHTWKQATPESGSSSYAWYHWQVAVELPRGETTIMSRAVDALGRTQPVDGSIYWNPAGYAWNGADTVTVEVA